MPIDLEKPEPFLFAFSDRGETFAVRVSAVSHAAARAAFAAMSASEKRARIVALMGAGERDHAAALASWLKAALLRLTRRPA